MNFRDQWAKDKEGKEFIFTVEMQRRLHEAGLPVEPESLSELPEQNGQQTRPAQRREERGRPKEQEQSIQPDTIQIDPATGKYLGRLKWFDDVKGYGFIARGAGEDIFFHKTESISDPNKFNEGQWLLYDVEEGRKGPEATEVEPYEGELLS